MDTKVKELMTKDPVIIPANATLQEAAQKMKLVECGILPVGKWDNLEGMITDRDIVIRALAEGTDPTNAQVRDYMTSEVYYCDEDNTLAEAAELMRTHEVSRLAVKDASGKTCGIITFGTMLREDDSLSEIGDVVESAVGKKAA